PHRSWRSSSSHCWRCGSPTGRPSPTGGEPVPDTRTESGCRSPSSRTGWPAPEQSRPGTGTTYPGRTDTSPRWPWIASSWTEASPPVPPRPPTQAWTGPGRAERLLARTGCDGTRWRQGCAQPPSVVTVHDVQELANGGDEVALLPGLATSLDGNHGSDLLAIQATVLHIVVGLGHRLAHEAGQVQLGHVLRLDDDLAVLVGENKVALVLLAVQVQTLHVEPFGPQALHQVRLPGRALPLCCTRLLGSFAYHLYLPYVLHLQSVFVVRHQAGSKDDGHEDHESSQDRAHTLTPSRMDRNRAKDMPAPTAMMVATFLLAWVSLSATAR